MLESEHALEAGISSMGGASGDTRIPGRARFTSQSGGGWPVPGALSKVDQIIYTHLQAEHRHRHAAAGFQGQCHELDDDLSAGFNLTVFRQTKVTAYWCTLALFA